MLKQGSFINRKYYKLFASSLAGAVAIGVNTVLDSVLSGSQLGETALTAVSIVAPLAFLLYFFSSIYTPGFGILYGKYNGEFNTEKAYRAAGQSMVDSAIMSLLLVIFFIAFKQPFLNYYDCTGELYEAASAYYNWLIPSAVLMPVGNSLYYLLAADADTLLLSIGGITGIVTNIVLSSALCPYLGVSGLGIGSVACLLVYCIIYSLHLLRKTNSIHFKFSFGVKEFITSAKLSSSMALTYLFVAVTDIVMNKVILVACGVEMIVAYSVINFVYSMYESFVANYSAATGMTATFMGERNNAGIRNVMKTTIKATIGLGLFMAVLLLIFAPQIPKIFGIVTPEVIDASVTAARWMALAAAPYGIAYVLAVVYPTFGKVKLAIVIASLYNLFCPLAMSIPLAYAVGFTGVSIGMGLNAYLVLALFAFYLIKKYGRKDFPLYLEDYGEDTVSFDLKVNKETIIEIRDAVKAELDRREYDIENIELLIEELYKRIYEKNSGKTVMSECALLFGEDYVRIIVRDDGVIFNFVDENNKVESLNAHILNSLLEQVQDKEYSLTTSFNRNGFIFEK